MNKEASAQEGFCFPNPPPQSVCNDCGRTPCRCWRTVALRVLTDLGPLRRDAFIDAVNRSGNTDVYFSIHLAQWLRAEGLIYQPARGYWAVRIDALRA